MTKIKIFRDPEQQKNEDQDDGSTRMMNDKSASGGAQKSVSNWEFSKENILPIEQGRKFDVLVNSLTSIPTTKDRRTIIDDRKKQFEDDLKANEGSLSDELDLWCEYIDWLEQNVPDGGKVNELSSVIEDCIERFHDKKELKQDKRVFNVFMKFRRFCDQPIELFHFMYANAICTLHAELYLKWSWHCELLRNLRRAEDLLKLGLKSLASPRESLVEAAEQLKIRINLMISNGDSLDVNTSRSSNGPTRTLQALKFQVTKNSGEVKVPINRICGSMGAPSGGLKSQTARAQQQQSQQQRQRATLSRGNTTANGAHRPPQIPTQIFSDQEITVSSTSSRSLATTGSSTSGLALNRQARLTNINENQNDNENVRMNDENSVAGEPTVEQLRAARRVNQIARRVPTSQQINALGRIGNENIVIQRSLIGHENAI